MLRAALTVIPSGCEGSRPFEELRFLASLGSPLPQAIGRHTGCLPACADPLHERTDMNLTVSLAPIVSLIAGVLILVMPRLLNYIVAIYLIVIGLLGLFVSVK